MNNILLTNENLSKFYDYRASQFHSNNSFRGNVDIKSSPCVCGTLDLLLSVYEASFQSFHYFVHESVTRILGSLYILPSIQ